jgi:hypothetical protein
VLVIMRKRILIGSAIAILSTAALTATATAAPGSARQPDVHTADTAPVQPPPADGGISGQACVLAVWEGPNFTGSSACFSMSQLADWDGIGYSDRTPMNDTASSTWNYGGSLIRLCRHRNYVECTRIVMHPDSGWAALNGWDNSVSSHFNASV